MQWENTNTLHGTLITSVIGLMLMGNECKMLRSVRLIYLVTHQILDRVPNYLKSLIGLVNYMLSAEWKD